MGATTLTVGRPAPAFALRVGDGQTVRLSELRGRRVILYFYPKDDTPGCTMDGHIEEVLHALSSLAAPSHGRSASATAA
ncbi:MAG: redoxin domain-containing protein [Candidatus Omnitrophica bacterium]|nr:redoxin domain-containing protein [Candidatus Omnitrophota bacterium]